MRMITIPTEMPVRGLVVLVGAVVTTPLWGLGLTQKINPQAAFLHGGRARSVKETILWHGGEADASRQAFLALAKPQRQALLRWLHQL